MSEPQLPQWTTLPPLPLRGVGTAHVESLDHYALRICVMLGRSRARLPSLLFAGVRGGVPKDSSPNPSSWIGPRSGYRRFLEALTVLTGQTDLHKGTFHCVSSVLGKAGLGSHAGIVKRRWCPQCYKNWDQDTSFEPLVWAFTMLARCPVHDVLMEAACRFCGSGQRFERAYDSRRNCQSCGRALGHEGIWQAQEGFQGWVDRTLCNFAKFVSSLDDPIDQSNYARFIDVIRARFLEGEPLPPALRLYFRSRSETWKKNVLPTIAQHLNFAAFQGCEIEDMLVTPESAAARPLFDRTSGFTQVPFSKRMLKPKVNAIGACMNAFLADPVLRLPALAILCKEFGVWADVVKEHHPDIHSRYRDRYLAQAGEFVRAHERRAIECALLVLKRVQNPKSGVKHLRSLAAEVVNQARVTEEAAMASIQAALVIRAFKRRSTSEKPRPAEYDQIANQWLSGK